MFSRKFLWMISVSILLVLIGASAATIIISGRLWLHIEARQAGGSGNVALEKQLELYEKHADELEKLLSFLLVLTALYGIALGVNAYQQAKDSSDRTDQITKRAEQSVEHLEKKLTALRNEAKQEVDEFLNRMRSTFPVFGGMDNAIRNIMFNLIRLLPILDWSEDGYRNLTNQEKQEICFYEKTVASFEYFDLGTLRGPASEIHHGLGNFYGLKFLIDGKDPDHWERSVFYLERAIRQNWRNIGALNDRAMLAISYNDPLKQPADLESFRTTEARKYFHQSLTVDPDQQRPVYNLAWFLHGEKKYKEAAEMLTEALEKDRWQETSSPPRRRSILYNRACAWSRSAETAAGPDLRSSLLIKAWGDLDEAFRPGTNDRILVQNLKSDLQPGGDLRPVFEDTSTRDRIQELIKRTGA